MKKIILSCLTICTLALGLVSCEDKEYTDTRVTYYASIDLEGDDYMVINKGSEYNEPGYSAKINGEDVTNQVKIVSNVNTSKSGKYAVTYSVTNADGFTAKVSRTVVVLNLSDPIEGLYNTTKESYRDREGTITKYGASYQLLVIGEGEGVYFVEDLLGGYYWIRAGYGTDYACAAKIKIAEDGTVSLLESAVPGWGDAASDLTGTYNADTRTFDLVTNYASMDFYVTMSK